MELTLSAADGTDLGSTSDFVLDLSFGDSGNNFELSCPSLPISCGCLVAVEGTEWGGLVDSCEDALEGGVSTTTWSGRTFHGLLCGKVLCPPAGQDYLTVEGDANDCLRSLVSRVGLGGFFTVPEAKAGVYVKCQFDRYCDAYTGIRKMLAASSARLMVRREDGRTLMWAEAAEAYGDGIDSDLLDFTAKRATRPVNHLVCAGTGELHERVIVHLYADEAGNVSRTQTLKGADEVCELYDHSSADEAKLVEDGTKKLKGYQSQGSVDVTVHDGLTLYVGDTVTAANREAGRTVTATVGKKIVKVSGGIAAISYEVGDAETGATGGTSAGHESSGGGVSYAAGEGIRITGGTISAEVTQAGLDAVSAAVSKASESAQGVANDLAAEAARAEAAEKANADAVSSEATRAKAAEQRNADAIAAESNTRGVEDGKIYNSLYRRPLASAIKLKDGEKHLTVESADGDGTIDNRAVVKLGTDLTDLTDADAALGSRVDAEAKSRADADAALSATAKELRTDVDAAAKALAGKPSKTDTSMTHWLVIAQNVGKYWCRLGTLVSQGDSSTVTIHVMTGHGYNGSPAQNSEFWAYIKDGFTSGAVTSCFGTTVELGANCGGVEVRVFAISATTCDVWVRLPWDYPNGGYTIQGTYKLWTPNNSKDNQADPPSPAGQVEQPVATRTIASTAYVDAHKPATASTADRLATARRLTLKGAVTGSATFDGSKDVTITCEGQGAAASFLAAHPVGSVYVTSSTTNPAGAHGGTWARVPYMDGVAWRRTA